MRAYIRHEYGLVDAAEVIEINNNGGYGGSVAVRTAVTRADGDGHVVARLMDPEAAHSRDQISTQDTLDADLKVSAKAAENLAYAISAAVRFAQQHDVPTVIDYDRETSKWKVTHLSVTATEPVIVK
jgi:hypothetical protein